MPQRSRDGDREISGDVIQMAGDKGLGALVDTLPVQKRGLVKFKNTGHLVHCFAQGFVDAPAYGEAPRAMRYDQISWVSQAFLQQYVNHYYRQTSFWFTICSTDREVIRWQGGFNDEGRGDKGDPRLPAFGRRLAVQVSEAQLPAHLKALADGKALVFGNIVFTQQGVRGQDGMVPWTQVDPLTFDRGVAVVKRAMQHKVVTSTRLGSIPNLPLLLTLYEDLRRGRLT